MINLKPVTLKNMWEIYELKADRNLVAPNNQSLAEAYGYYAEYGKSPLVYGIYNCDMPVGFMMVAYDPPHKFANINNNGQAFYYLWRLMIDDAHQNKGYGRAAMKLVIAEAKAHAHGEANAFYTSVVPESTVTPSFYGSFGFVKTGEIDEGEEVMRLEL
ncbi:MAG: GNAT family N-acetyltransferase [Defluviitaleaceae bacterium]|nr:GNAT family N-acetyltransferase [Defluviitaleaceae bacterium]